MAPVRRAAPRTQGKTLAQEQAGRTPGTPAAKPTGRAARLAGGSGRHSSDRYKWIALTNTTSGVLLVTIDSTIVIIAMPAIFRGIGLDPLEPGNSFFLLWMILGYLIVTSVLVVSLGRMGDMFGRVRMYNLGFLIFAIASVMLSVDWLKGAAGAMWLIVFRIVQGIGGANISANSGAILTDAFPTNQRGMALGLNNVASIAGRSWDWWWVACWPPSTGGWCSSCRCRSPSSAPCGPTSARGARRAQPGAHRLAGQRHLRRRPDC